MKKRIALSYSFTDLELEQGGPAPQLGAEGGQQLAPPPPETRSNYDETVNERAFLEQIHVSLRSSYEE
ncbi:unnamed protein product [Heligmosomoides polygyrus]|uniref:Shieldin complex subunit 1 n=1 Tax=Heligmosomoides polygyrus TaxID=6339 RepID=A0A183FXI6_HELPZ|nr:unnamed protein product [Heligmosomoides polygyrus]